MKKLTTLEMEIALANYLNPRVNLIVPNVSWGFFNHECDILAVSKSGYATEYEIKISKADLLKDKKKEHKHEDHRIKALYFAIPAYLQDCIEHIPERAGIVIAEEYEKRFHVNGIPVRKNTLKFRLVRQATDSPNPYKFTDADKFQIARLGAMRIWGLKEKLMKVGGINETP